MSNLIFNLRIGKIHFQITEDWKFRVSKNNAHKWFEMPIVKFY